MIIPSPGSQPSSLESNKICNPKQIPKKGLPDAIAALMGASKFRDLKCCTAGSNAPTPGNTIASAFSNSFAESVTLGVAPAFSKPLQTECKFPMS